MAAFGMTAKDWNEENPEKAKKGNIRDFADIVQLNVVADLWSSKAGFVKKWLVVGSPYDPFSYFLLARS